jgi:hypothetical protein
MADVQHGSWVDSAFTVFACIRFTALDTGFRQTVVASGEDNSLDLGVACDKSVGMFAEESYGRCWPLLTAGSNLFVTTGQWYVLTWRSLSGVSAGAIDVNAWLNGQQAGSTLHLDSARAGSYLMIGAGELYRSGGPTGYLNADIAELIMYRGALTEQQRKNIEVYLVRKYNLAGYQGK